MKKLLAVCVLTLICSAQSGRNLSELTPEEKDNVIRYLFQRQQEAEKRNEALVLRYNQLVAEYNQLASRPVKTRIVYQPVPVETQKSLRCSAFTMGENTTVRCY